jgi:putative FmdB family regulatory protein
VKESVPVPLYEYQCDACGHRFEAIQKFSDPPLETCPKCGGTIHKLIAAPAFQFKGTGWYVTDYARKDSGGKAESSAKNASNASPGEAAKTEKSDKPAEKSAASDTASAPSSPGTPAAKSDG